MGMRAFFLVITAWAAQAASFQNVSAASGTALLAPDSIASAMGDGLATQEIKTDGVTLLTSLGGISVQVVDSGGTARLAGLYYVSAKQINYVVPAGTLAGTATVNILNNGAATGLSAPAAIQSAAPSLFSANGDG